MDHFKKDRVDRALDELSELVEKHLGFHVSGQSRRGASVEPMISKHNSDFEKAGYLYSGEMNFFHVTSVQNLFSILNSKTIRLYNLHNSSDQNEFFHAGNRTGLFSDEIMERLKDFVHIFSFSPISELDEPYVWENYGGGHYQGVAICFSIQNDPLDWENYHIADVRYNDYVRIDNFKLAFDLFRKKYPFISQYIDLSRVLPFHKSEEFRPEKEVRLLHYPKFDHLAFKNYSHYEYKVDPGRNRDVRYFDLPLWIDSESPYISRAIKKGVDVGNIPLAEYFSNTPRIKIERIVFGQNCGITAKEFRDVRDNLDDLIRYRFGYRANIEWNFYKKKV